MSNQALDPRPFCIACGKRWIPSDKTNASKVPCSNCVAVFLGKVAEKLSEYGFPPPGGGINENALDRILWALDSTHTAGAEMEARGDLAMRMGDELAPYAPMNAQERWSEMRKAFEPAASVAALVITSAMTRAEIANAVNSVVQSVFGKEGPK